MSRTARHRRTRRAVRVGLGAAALVAATGVSAYASGGTTYAGAEARTGQARERNGALAALAARVEEQAATLARAWVLPLAPGYRLTAGFGECSSLWAHCHTGLDFAAPTGTPIRAVTRGRITEVGDAGAYGNRTVETLEDGTELWYCHQVSIDVRVGDEVAAGQQIGRVGSTGNTTGPHLHLEVRPGAGDPVDPAVALAAHGATP
jgi:murein DD-endopeptidase MepM/ murein hydrolase activator NlpD